jgi:energy-coupling factor transport system ATP-binding protein
MNQNPQTAIEWRGVRFRYPAASADSLDNVDLAIGAGEFVLLTGPTGCGKSTLLKTINGLIPRESAGQLEGEVSFFGRAIESIPVEELRAAAGLLFQNPDDQLLCSCVQEEVAFGPENLGLAPNLIASRVEDALAWTGAGEKRFALCGELSGGEKQRAALASVLSMGTVLLALDEPTSQLDGEGVGLILQSLNAVRRHLGATVIIAEHRLDRILPLADRLIIMDKGSIRGDFRKGRFIEALPHLKELGCEAPPWMELAAREGLNGSAEEEESLCQTLKASGLRMTFPENENHWPKKQETILLRADGITHRYPRADAPSLDNLSFDVNGGEILAMMGHNGSGKTTLLNLFAGLLSPQEGRLERFGQTGSIGFQAGRVGYLFQNPDLMLSMETVEAELELGARLLRLDPTRAEAAISMSIGLLRLQNHVNRNPFSLSRGERLRVALGALLAMDPQVLLLDEPTAGLDRGMRLRFLEDLSRWVRERRRERAVVLCTHDAEAALGFADRCLVLRHGAIVAIGPADEVLFDAGSGPLTEVEPSPVTRIARRLGYSQTPRTTAALIGGITGDE